MKTFNELWNYLIDRQNRGITLVQERSELEHIFNLIQGCESYLEVGTAEGNSLYVLALALKESPKIVCIDFGEEHTKDAKKEITDKLPSITQIVGNSHNLKTILKTFPYGLFDVVFIDAGHKYTDVIADAIAYGSLATKYIIFHDIQLPEVKAAFDWYCAQNPQMKRSTFINSETYGYGILEIC